MENNKTILCKPSCGQLLAKINTKDTLDYQIWKEYLQNMRN